MLLGLNTQALLLFDDVLDILKEMTDDELDVEQYGGISESVLNAIDAPELEKLIKVHIAKGKASATTGNPSPETYQNALDVSVQPFIPSLLILTYDILRLFLSSLRIPHFYCRF